MKKGAEHAMKDHGMKEEDITTEMKQKIRGVIRSFYYLSRNRQK